MNTRDNTHTPTAPAVPGLEYHTTERVVVETTARVADWDALLEATGLATMEHELVYVDYRDELAAEDLDLLRAGDLDELQFSVTDCYYDARWEGAHDTVRDTLERLGVDPDELDTETTDELEGFVMQWDQSDPLATLLRRTELVVGVWTSHAPFEGPEGSDLDSWGLYEGTPAALFRITGDVLAEFWARALDAEAGVTGAVTPVLEVTGPIWVGAMNRYSGGGWLEVERATVRVTADQLRAGWLDGGAGRRVAAGKAARAGVGDVYRNNWTWEEVAAPVWEATTARVVDAD